MTGEQTCDPLEPLGDRWTTVDRAELEEAWRGQRWDVSERVWLRLWRRLGDPPPQHPLILYRGATRQGRRGMSWTPHRSVAEDYAALGSGNVYRTTVEPSAVLAILPTGEVVLDPRRLGRIDLAEDRTSSGRPATTMEERYLRGRGAARRWDSTYERELRSRRGNGRSAMSNAIAARRAADRKARRR